MDTAAKQARMAERRKTVALGAEYRTVLILMSTSTNEDAELTKLLLPMKTTSFQNIIVVRCRDPDKENVG